MEFIDFVIILNDIYMHIKNKITSFFTITIDPLQVSKDPIKCKNCKDFGGFSVIISSNEKHRRIVHWFYRNTEVPTLNDWIYIIYLFNLRDIPCHILQLYDFDKQPLNKFILVHAITSDYINYTYEDRDNNVSDTVTVPLGTSSLLPEYFLYNLKLYSKSK